MIDGDLFKIIQQDNDYYQQHKTNLDWGNIDTSNLNHTTKLFGGIYCNIIDHARAGVDIASFTAQDVYEMCLKLENKK